MRKLGFMVVTVGATELGLCLVYLNARKVQIR